MRGETVVQLRRGLDAAGRDAVIRSVTGADEALFAQAIASLSPARAATAIITAVTARIGTLSPVTPDDARMLSVGDRHRLLIALYRALHGPRLSLVAPCLAPGCGRTMDVELSLDDLLDEPIVDEVPLVNDLRVALDDRTIDVRFRVPNGGDQEAASAFAASDVARAADLILRRTILAITPALGGEDEWEACLSALRAPLAAAFARLDPEAELVLRLACPDCGHETPADLDPYGLFKSRVSQDGDVLLEVDRIARAYHWSEAEILALPVARRRRYLSLIEGAGVSA